jgi:hypothetical protein
MTILLFPQQLQREVIGPGNRIVIPTGAERSVVEGPAVSFPGTHTPSEARIFFKQSGHQSSDYQSLF